MTEKKPAQKKAESEPASAPEPEPTPAAKPYADLADPTRGAYDVLELGGSVVLRYQDGGPVDSFTVHDVER